MNESMSTPSRVTRQRAAVMNLLEEVDDFRTAQQLHIMLVQRGVRVGLTTVYRTLQIFVDSGDLDSMRLPGGEQLFRRCAGTGHHHHLVCRVCGRAVEIEGPAVEQWADRVASEHGFTDVSHAIDLFGTCADCARR